jgi:hypothetical protein
MRILSLCVFAPVREISVLSAFFVFFAPFRGYSLSSGRTRIFIGAAQRS